MLSRATFACFKTYFCNFQGSYGSNFFDRVFHRLLYTTGLTPENNESAGKKKSVRISRAGVYIKPLLVQCANAAIKSKDYPYFKVRYQKIKQRRGHKKAIIAIARMLLVCIYHMLSKNEAFDASRYTLDTTPKPKTIQPNDIHQAIELLKALGAEITLPATTHD